MKNSFEKGKNLLRAAAVTVGLSMTPLAAHSSSNIETSFAKKQEKDIEKKFHKESDGHVYDATIDYRRDSLNVLRPVGYHFKDFDRERGITIETFDIEHPVLLEDTAVYDSAVLHYVSPETELSDGIPDRMVETFPDGKKLILYFDGTSYQVDGWDEIMRPKDNPGNELDDKARNGLVKRMRQEHAKMREVFKDVE